MSNMPLDLQVKALDVVLKFTMQNDDAWDELVLQALFDERDRCALVAEQWASEASERGDNEEEFAASQIAIRIRGKVEGGPTAAVGPTPINAINQPNEDKPASGEEEKLHV